MTETDTVGSCFTLGGFPLQYYDLKQCIRCSGGQASSAKERCPLDRLCHLVDSAHTSHYAFIQNRMESFDRFYHSNVKREDLCEAGLWESC